MDKSYIIPLFVMDEEQYHPDKVGVNRMKFLIESLKDLDKSLFNHLGLRLMVAKGSPQSVFEKLVKAFNVQYLSFESQYPSKESLELDDDVEVIFARSNFRND